jgi:hypothetical protein
MKGIKMKVYNIKTTYCSYGQIHCVVAESMAEAERIFKAKYWPTEIEAIALHSNYVQIQQYDEQPKTEER